MWDEESSWLARFAAWLQIGNRAAIFQTVDRGGRESRRGTQLFQSEILARQGAISRQLAHQGVLYPDPTGELALPQFPPRPMHH
jgi:hypothetical protein